MYEAAKAGRLLYRSLRIAVFTVALITFLTIVVVVLFVFLFWLLSNENADGGAIKEG